MAERFRLRDFWLSETLAEAEPQFQRERGNLYLRDVDLGKLREFYWYTGIPLSLTHHDVFPFNVLRVCPLVLGRV